MNAILADSTMERLPQAALQPSDAFTVERLYTSVELSAMNDSTLASIVGTTEVTERDELINEARAVQLRRLGSFIRSFEIGPQEDVAVVETAQDAVATDVETLVEPRLYDKYLAGFAKFDTDEIFDEHTPERTEVSYFDVSEHGELASFDKRLSGLSKLEQLSFDVDDLDSAVFIPDSERKVENIAQARIVSGREDFTKDDLRHLDISLLTSENTIVEAVDAAIVEGGTIRLPHPGGLYSERIRRSMNVMSDKTRGALTAARETFSSVINKITPSPRTVYRAGLAATGVAMFGYAYNNISNPFESSHRQSSSQENSQAVAGTPATAPLETAPAETTIEVTTTTPETIPTTTAAREQTTTTVEVTTTTEELSLYEKVLLGEADRSQLSGSLITQIDIPSLCLKGIDAYGSMKRASNDPALLQAYLESGVLTQVQHDLLLSGKAPHSLEVYLFDKFDPIYKLYPAETPQQACEDVIYNPAYPQRWLRTLDDASKPGMETEKLTAVEPVVDINWEYGLPGEVGRVIVTGHRTTMSAPLVNSDQLEPGDTVTFRIVDGKEFTYVIESSESVRTDEEFAEAMNYKSPSGSEKLLAVATCDEAGENRLVHNGVLLETA